MCRGMGDAVQEIIPLYLGAWAGVPKEPQFVIPIGYNGYFMEAHKDYNCGFAKLG